jgi:hypothetical protein
VKDGQKCEEEEEEEGELFCLLKILNHILYLLFLVSGLQINTFFAILTLKINDQSNRTQEIDLVLTCKHDGGQIRRLQIL